MTPGSLTASGCAGALLVLCRRGPRRKISPCTKYGNSHIVKTVPNASATRLDAKAEMTFEAVPGKLTTLEVMTLGCDGFAAVLPGEKQDYTFDRGYLSFLSLWQVELRPQVESPSL